jgi:Rod binding domain-containing protein
MRAIELALTQPVKPLEPGALAAGTKAAPDPKALKAARDFEAVLLRQMMSSLQKTTQTAKKGPMTGGGDVQSSMMVNVLADAMAAAGGIGLAEVLLRDGSLGGTRTNRGDDAVGLDSAKVSGNPSVHMDSSRSKAPG